MSNVKRSSTSTVSKYVPRKRAKYIVSVPPAVRQYIKKEIHRNIENKEYTSYAINQTVSTALTGVQVPFQINLLPELGVGTGPGNRLGSQVQPVYGEVKGFVNLLPFNEVTNPFLNIYVKLYLIKWKQQTNQGANIGDSNLDDFFQSGPNTTVGFQGNMLDMLLPVNSEEFICYSTKTIKLGVGMTGAGHAYGNNQTPSDNSTYSAEFSMKYIPSVLKQKLTYDDSATERPINTNLRLFIQAVSSDGSGPVARTPVEVHYAHTFKYEDA
jgi:hypothetical protein